MKKSRFLVLASVCFCCLLTGCVTTTQANTKRELTQVEKDMIENARTAYDVAPLMTRTADYLKYSECAQDGGFAMYFDLLGGDEYTVVSQNGENYLLFYYSFSSYSEEMTAVTQIEQRYDGDILHLTVEKRTKASNQRGCFPTGRSARCIVKLEQDISTLYVNEKPFSVYDGGFIRVCDLTGVVDAELNIIVPIEYDMIRDYEVYDTDNRYYYTATEHGVGLMDESYQTLLKPQYVNIIFVDDNTFVVGRGPHEDFTLENAAIGIVDRNGNLLHDYIDGFISGDESFHNDVHQAVFGRMQGGQFLKGVVDDHLNVIIEPKYKAVSVFSFSEKNDRFYVVENLKGKFAVIDSSGKQQTEFVNTSVYDVQTQYYKTLRGGF